ncbi:hypothetical protein ARMGADRAFT_870591, partial [Armillaria gallica]
MTALCRSKCYIFQLKEDRSENESGYLQKGMKGHVIVYPQQPSHIAQTLPPSIEEITSPICVLFVGSEKPTDAWLRHHTKPLTVNGGHVRHALKWLKENNPLYRDIEFNESVLQELDQNPILPIYIQHILPSVAGDTLTSRYEAPEQSDRLPAMPPQEVVFENIVITNVDAGASSNNLCAATVRHIKQKGGGYMELPHDPEPVEEFYNPSLFPYGIGGLENHAQAKLIALKTHVKY